MSWPPITPRGVRETLAWLLALLGTICAAYGELGPWLRRWLGLGG